MSSSRDILVTTASHFEGLAIKKHLRPVSAHLVAGTNLVSDFFASFTDVFGGRSQSYQNQLSSLYTDAIERLKTAAFETGANAVIGLHVDLDEIAGKGKSMFMVTAIGTAVVLDLTLIKNSSSSPDERHQQVSVEQIKMLQQRKEMISKAENNTLDLDDNAWDFIITNQVVEIYPFILEKLKLVIKHSRDNQEMLMKFNKKFLSYLSSVEESIAINLIYDSFATIDDLPLLEQLFELAKKLYLLDLDKLRELMTNEKFDYQKRALQVLTFDKISYDRKDADKLLELAQAIPIQFPEKGIRSFKKQLLSSKEKEVWTCTCKNVVDMEKYCGNCKTDIFGFTANETAPPVAVAAVKEKIALINELMTR